MVSIKREVLSLHEEIIVVEALDKGQNQGDVRKQIEILRSTVCTELQLHSVITTVFGWCRYNQVLL